MATKAVQMQKASSASADESSRYKPYDISPEERARRSEMARRMNQEVVDPETGRRRFGGPQPGSGRPRKRRAAEIVAEEATKNAEDIVSVLKDGLKSEVPLALRLQTVKQWLEIENKEAALQLQEDRELERLDQHDLAARVAASLERLARAGALTPSAEDPRADFVVEGEIVEFDGDQGG